MMTKPKLRLVYDAEAPATPPRAQRSLADADALVPLLQELAKASADGELLLRGPTTARVCLFDGKIAWIRLTDHPEHLGDVMRRELGLPASALRQAIAHCREAGLRLDEGMVALGLVEPGELRDCLRRHFSDQLLEVLAWPGPLTVEHSEWPHRFDRTFTFDLDELLARPLLPSPVQRRVLIELVERCRGALHDLTLACVIESEEGTVLHSAGVDDPAAEDLLSLCVASLQRLAANRITHDDGPLSGIVLSTMESCLVIQPLSWRPGWMLVLGGRSAPGLLLAVASEAAGPLA
ncbi:MAG: hypothetical protein KDK70_13160 [Myxococcales bacterium]|nr:hypothetical protein [Myxococcales bacterium]